MTAPEGFDDTLHQAALPGGRVLVVDCFGDNIQAFVVDLTGDRLDVRSLAGGSWDDPTVRVWCKLADTFPPVFKHLPESLQQPRATAGEPGRVSDPTPDPEPSSEPSEPAEETAAETDTADGPGKTDYQDAVYGALEANGAPMRYVSLGWGKPNGTDAVLVNEDWEEMDGNVRDQWRDATDEEWFSIDWGKTADGGYYPERKYVEVPDIEEHLEVSG